MIEMIFKRFYILYTIFFLVIALAHDGGADNNQGGGDSSTAKLSVMISYESDNFYAEKFFREQLTAEVLEEFSKCGVIRWNFMPCPTSSMVNGALMCRNGEAQCASDKIHACADTLYQKDQQQVGKFVICYFKNKNAEQCASENAMSWDDIDKCVKAKNGDRYCNAFFDRIVNDWQVQLYLGIKFGSKYDATLNFAASSDFKGVLCAELKNNNLKCNFCPGD